MKGSQFIPILFCVWRFYRMYKQTMGFVRGIGAGIVAGVAIAAVGNRMMRDNRSFRRRANKTLHTVGELMDSVQYMFR